MVVVPAGRIGAGISREILQDRKVIVGNGTIAALSCGRTGMLEAFRFKGLVPS